MAAKDSNILWLNYRLLSQILVSKLMPSEICSVSNNRNGRVFFWSRSKHPLLLYLMNGLAWSGFNLTDFAAIIR